jgi:hypothetical protein
MTKLFVTKNSPAHFISQGFNSFSFWIGKRPYFKKGFAIDPAIGSILELHQLEYSRWEGSNRLDGKAFAKIAGRLSKKIWQDVTDTYPIPRDAQTDHDMYDAVEANYKEAENLFRELYPEPKSPSPELSIATRHMYHQVLDEAVCRTIEQKGRYWGEWILELDINLDLLSECGDKAIEIKEVNARLHSTIAHREMMVCEECCQRSLDYLSAAIEGYEKVLAELIGVVEPTTNEVPLKPGQPF